LQKEQMYCPDRLLTRTMRAQGYYETLKVSRNATDEQIKKAYRKLVMHQCSGGMNGGKCSAFETLFRRRPEFRKNRSGTGPNAFRESDFHILNPLANEIIKTGLEIT